MIIYLKKNKNKLFFWVCILTVSIVSFGMWRFINVYLGITGNLNVDDLASIQFASAGDNFFSKLYGIIKNDPTNVPLFYVMLFWWLNLFGYSPDIIRILPEIFALFFIVVMGMIGRKVLSKNFGIITAILAGTSIQLMYASYQIRAYSLLMLCSAVLFLAWLCKENSRYSLFFLMIALLMVSFTHFFGVLVCAALGSWDLFCCLSKRKSKKILFPYIGYVLLFGPYMVVSYFNAKQIWETFWPPVPNYLNFIEMLESLCVGKSAGFVIFLIMAFLYLILLLKRFQKQEDVICINKNILVCFWIVFAVITVGFVYSRYINPTSSVWVYRYFLVIYPFVLVIVTYGIVHLYIWIKNVFCIKQSICIAFVLASVFIYHYKNMEYAISHGGEINTGGFDIAAISEYLASQENIDDDRTLVFFPYPEFYFDGWISFYTQGGKRNKPNVCCTEGELLSWDLQEYDCIYTIEIVYDLTEQEKGMITRTHQLIEENCNNIAKVNKYMK